MKPYFAFAALAAIAPHAVAQQAAHPHPADPAAKTPPVKYESAFTGYVPYREGKIEQWRDLNDEVGRVGGHVGMFGGAGHDSAGKPAPSKPATGQPAAGKSKELADQPPARSAPQAPKSGHTGH